MLNNQPKTKEKCVRWYKFVPVAGLLLLAFLAQPSSWIFPEGYQVAEDSAGWHRSFFGVADWLLCASILMGLVAKKIQPPESAYWYCLFFLLLVFLSILPTIVNDYLVGIELIQHAIRLIFLFLFGAGLTRSYGGGSAVQLLYVIFYILAFSSLVVMSMQMPNFHRASAAGMTVGSFGQLSAIVGLFAIHLRHIKMATFAIMFLILSFSLTSALAFSICLLFFPLKSEYSRLSGTAILHNRVYVVLGFLAFILLCLIINACSSRGYNFSIDDASTLHGRLAIWKYGINILRENASGWLGVGFGNAPSFLRFRNFAFEAGVLSSARTTLYYGNFHSILLESLISMGVLAVPIFVLFVLFLINSYKHKCYLEASIISFFVVTQSVDFTIYRPKQEVVFAFVLGILLARFNLKKTENTRVIRNSNKYSMTASTKVVGYFRKPVSRIG